MVLGAGLRDSACPTETVVGAEAGESGQATFNAGSTYTLNVVFTISFDFMLPSDCLNGQTCAMVDANLKGNIAAGNVPGIASGSCSGSASCVCHAVASPTPDVESGTYAISGNVLTTTPATGTGVGTASQVDYCIQGNTAHFIDVSTSMNMGTVGPVVILDDAVAVKQ